MTRSSLLVFFLLGVFPCPGVSQDVSTLSGFPRSGQVADAATRAPLSGVIVEVPELGIRVISDDSGRVDLGRLPNGRFRLTTEVFGYDNIREGELPVPWDEDFLILLDRDPTADPSAPGRIVGRIMEEGRRNRGVSNVEVTLLGASHVGTVTDGRGRFELRDLDPGLVEVRFTHLSYAPRTTTVVVQPGGTVEISATMSTRPIELEEIEVTVRSAYLERNGFYRRARFSWGKQYMRADLEDLAPTYLSDVFWRVPGVSVRHGSNGAQVMSGRSRGFTSPGGCPLAVYLDDMRLRGWDLDSITPWSLEAVEIYRGISTPIQYWSGPSPGCGVILLWTRR